MAKVEEYTGLRTLAALEHFHARIALAERMGALRAERDVNAGDGSRLVRLMVVDAAALAAAVGVELLEDRIAAAQALLVDWRDRFPVVEEVLSRWRDGGKVRGAGPEAAADLRDAAKAVAARREDHAYERVLRRESTRLFGDSKRLEKLTRWLELIATGELAAGPLPDVEVWAMLGLRREPQPFLVAGTGEADVAGMALPLVRPFIGLPVEQLRGLATGVRCVLSIENLASFHDAAQSADAGNVLLLYTGGMPSPAWRAAYRRVLAGIDPTARVFHWGDIDEGGFRIAATLAATAAEAGYGLRPWLMSPDQLPPAVRSDAATPNPAELERLCRWAARAGWEEVSTSLRRQPMLLEQEMLEPVLPAPDAS
ncbi:Wadjet anti-phage system protein JetD domain-containing protein [Arenimonas composti]|nr:Wadjet anti-phage system protein JetD domain-containing protein [Arenimonas composti]